MNGSRRPSFSGPWRSAIRIFAAQSPGLDARPIVWGQRRLHTEGRQFRGAYLAGAVPHRAAGGTSVGAGGLPARSMLEAALKAYVLLGPIDPEVDFAAGAGALAAADFVIAATTHLPDSLRASAHVVLPIGSFAETSGTFVNAEAAAKAGRRGEAGGREPAGLEGIAVLANLLNLQGFDYVSSEEIRDALKSQCADRVEASSNGVLATGVGAAATAVAAARDGAAGIPEDAPTGAWLDIPPYQSDALVRGSEALSKTKDGRMTRTVI